MVLRSEDVPGSNVAMDEPLLGKVVNPGCHLPTVAQQSVWQAGVHLFIRSGRRVGGRGGRGGGVGGRRERKGGRGRGREGGGGMRVYNICSVLEKWFLRLLWPEADEVLPQVCLSQQLYN